jgi:hypothetical protein
MLGARRIRRKWPRAVAPTFFPSIAVNTAIPRGRGADPSPPLGVGLARSVRLPGREDRDHAVA